MCPFPRTAGRNLICREFHLVAVLTTAAWFSTEPLKVTMLLFCSKVGVFSRITFRAFRSSLLSLDIEIDAGGPLQFTKPLLAQTLAGKLHAHVHAGGPPQDLHPSEGHWVTRVPEALHTLVLQVLLLSSNFALSSLGQKIYCISAFLSQEWIEFIPFSANNNRQSGNLVENK